jgi:hypothetical protein
MLFAQALLQSSQELLAAPLQPDARFQHLLLKPLRSGNEMVLRARPA